MNYDLFIPPQFKERAVAVPIGTTKRDGAVGTRERARAPQQGDRDDVLIRHRAQEEVSSDERNTKKIQEAVELVNRLFDRSPVDLNLSIDKDTNSLVIKLIERESHKVIRQIPPDEMLRLRRHLQELLGVIFDETA